MRAALIDCICLLAALSARVQPPCLKHCFSSVPMTTRPSCSLRAQPLCLLHAHCAVHWGLCRSPHYRFSHACAFWLLLGTTTELLRPLHTHSVDGGALLSTSTSRGGGTCVLGLAEDNFHERLLSSVMFGYQEF